MRLLKFVKKFVNVFFKLIEFTFLISGNRCICCFIFPYIVNKDVCGTNGVWFWHLAIHINRWAFVREVERIPKGDAGIRKEMLQKDDMIRMVSVGNERGTLHATKVQPTGNLLAVRRSNCFFFVLHIHILHINNHLGRPHESGLTTSYRPGLQELSYSAQMEQENPTVSEPKDYNNYVNDDLLFVIA